MYMVIFEMYMVIFKYLVTPFRVFKHMHLKKYNKVLVLFYVSNSFPFGINFEKKSKFWNLINLIRGEKRKYYLKVLLL